MTTLIFDCDGVLSDTERYGHLPAFNQVFEEFELPVRWSVEEYGEKLRIGGGKERLLSLLTPEFVRAAALPFEPAAQAEQVSRWHARKSALYQARVARGALPPRPGVPRVIADALGAGWQLAVASTSALGSVEAVLRVAAGPEGQARFAGVFAGDMVPRKKPAPDIYQLALARLEADPARTLVIEDSRNGLEAAVAAGLRCVITVNGYTEQERFDEAMLVVDHLGDPETPSRVLANRSGARVGRFVTLADLEACLAG